MLHKYPAPRLASELTHKVAEGPVWDSARRRALWVDIPEGRVFSATLSEGGALQVEEVIKFPDTAGAVAVSAGGELLVAGRHRLYTRGNDGEIHAGPAVLPDVHDRRLNDGKADPAGRFLVGSLRSPGLSTSEVLVRVAGGEVTLIDDDLTLSNGLAWSVDGALLYSVDTLARRIYVRSYDPGTGETGARRVFVELVDGSPDGLCIDSEDHLWLAVWGKGEVHRYSPAGKLVGLIDVPAPYATSVGFIGHDLDTLVITTAAVGLTEQQLNEYPLSGRLFTLKPGVTGPNPPYWSGQL